MRKITADELFDVLRHDTDGKFFSVTFQRRTSRPNRTAVAGDMRTMLCRTGMSSYKKGVISDASRDAEDLRCAVLTVWDVGAYRNNRRLGMSPEQSGYNAWRRIDLVTVQQCSLLDDAELPPKFVAEYHEITNLFRLANMPKIRR